MQNAIENRGAGRETMLRGVVRLFEDSQRRRLALVEQLRAVLQGRDATWPVDATLTTDEDADAALARIEAATWDGPVPILARRYRDAMRDERECVALVAEAVRAHPAWPWLEEVRGIGPVLAGRLLARLDVARATRPSAFWAYCGLGTIATSEGRRAPQWMTTAGRPVYDRAAKQACYLIGVSFTRQGGRYKAYYKAARARVDAAHPEWGKLRCYRAALRLTEKRFLVDLWTVWRAALGLEVPGPHPDVADPVTPWEMIG